MLISFNTFKINRIFHMMLLFSGRASIVITISPYTGIHFPPLVYACQFAYVLTDKLLAKLGKTVCISHERKLI